MSGDSDKAGRKDHQLWKAKEMGWEGPHFLLVWHVLL